MEQIAVWKMGAYGVTIVKSPHPQERYPFRVSTSVFDGVQTQSNHYGKYKTLRSAEKAARAFQSALGGTWTQTHGAQR